MERRNDSHGLANSASPSPCHGLTVLAHAPQLCMSAPAGPTAACPSVLRSVENVFENCWHRSSPSACSLHGSNETLEVGGPHTGDSLICFMGLNTHSLNSTAQVQLGSQGGQMGKEPHEQTGRQREWLRLGLHFVTTSQEGYLNLLGGQGPGGPRTSP